MWTSVVLVVVVAVSIPHGFPGETTWVMPSKDGKCRTLKQFAYTTTPFFMDSVCRFYELSAEMYLVGRSAPAGDTR